MTQNKSLKVEIKIKHLKRIAEFYEFPLAVFFAPDTIFSKHKTRSTLLRQKAENFDKIIDFIEDLK